MVGQMIELIGWISFIISIIGSLLVIYKKRSGFIFWIISNTLWMIVNIKAGIYSQASMFAFFNLTSLYGYLKWRE
jgi:nicotinamide riboside transporter PnuC